MFAVEMMFTYQQNFLIPHATVKVVTPMIHKTKYVIANILSFVQLVVRTAVIIQPVHNALQILIETYPKTMFVNVVQDIMKVMCKTVTFA